MFSPVTICLKDLNPLVTCSICHGYLIDATSLNDCHHSFCRSCIMKHALTSNVCPVCGLVIHKTKPELNLVADKNLQQIVYKLIPGLLKDEMKRRDEFYSQNKDAEKGINDSIIESDYAVETAGGDKTNVCIFIKIMKTLNSDDGKVAFVKKSKKYLFCPGLFSVRLLKKFIHDKCELEEVDNVEVVHSSDDEFLPDHYTLLDVAEIYNWRADSPLELKCIVWRESDFFSENSASKMPDSGKESKLSHDGYPFQSFKEFCRHVRKTKICPFVSPKKRHSKVKSKHGFKDITNVHHCSKKTSKVSRENEMSTGTSRDQPDHLENTAESNSSFSQEGCKLKLRIKTKGIEDSVLVLPSDAVDSSGFHLSDTLNENYQLPVQEKSCFSVNQILNENLGDRSFKRFMSKKDMLLSKLNLDKGDSSTMDQDIPKLNAASETIDQPSAELRKNPHIPNGSSEKEPLTISVGEEKNIISTPSYNFKKKLLLTTVPARAKGQLWTPYKSPLKELSRQEADGTSPSGESKRSKSPVIIFNPALPLPSFTSLLQSFGSKNVGSETPLDHSSSAGHSSVQANLNSKIGVFISKGKSMTLEQKTKLVGDATPNEGSAIDVDTIEHSDNNPEDKMQDDSCRKVEESAVSEIANDDSKDAVQVKESERVQRFKARNNFGRCKQKTPPWLGKRIQLKKINHVSTSDGGKAVAGDFLKSPQRKKPMLEKDIKNENSSCLTTQFDETKELPKSKMHKISNRALKILN